MRTKEERPSVKDVKHSDEVERESFAMEKTEFLPNVQTEEKKENAESVQSGTADLDGQVSGSAGTWICRRAGE